MTTGARETLVLLAAACALGACDDGTGTTPNPDAGEPVCVVVPNGVTRFPGLDASGGSAPPRVAYAGHDLVFDAAFLSASAGNPPAANVARVDARAGALVMGPLPLAPGPAQTPWIAPGLVFEDPAMPGVARTTGSMVAWVGGTPGASLSRLYAQPLDPATGLPSSTLQVLATTTGAPRLRQLVPSAAALPPNGYAAPWNPDPTRLDVETTDANGMLLTMREVAPPDSPALLDAATVLVAGDAGVPAAALALLVTATSGTGDAVLLVDAQGNRLGAPMPLVGTDAFASEVLLVINNELRILALRTGAGTGNTQLMLARFAPEGVSLAPSTMLVGAVPTLVGDRGSDIRSIGAAWDGSHVWIAWNDRVRGAVIGRLRGDGAGVTDVRSLSLAGAMLTVGSLAVGNGRFAVGAIDPMQGPVVVTGQLGCPSP